MQSTCWLPWRSSSASLVCAAVVALQAANTATGLPQPQHQPPPPPSAAAAAHDAAGVEAWQFLASYPRQYITYRLQPGEHIEIDGQLDEPAWNAVNWTEPMEDIAQSFYPGLSIPAAYATLMKVRYDRDYLYVAAKYYQSLTWATLTGHNDELTAGLAPYSNDDFEVFLDPSGTSHGYSEFEMNARNATCGTLV
eukprot:COSAG01_NODE_2972_length_6774_cov_7.923146_5_plen_194_part_00